MKIDAGIATMNPARAAQGSNSAASLVSAGVASTMSPKTPANAIPIMIQITVAILAKVASVELPPALQRFEYALFGTQLATTPAYVIDPRQM